MIELISPLGYPRVEAQAQRRSLATLEGRRLGFIWNQYQTTQNFWRRLESAVQDLCKPAAVRRAYKTNTWTPLDRAQFSELAASVDYLVIGVGA